MSLALGAGSGDSAIDLRSAMHRRLALAGRRRLNPDVPDANWRQALQDDLATSLIEGQFIESERRGLGPMIEALPPDADGFMRWFESLCQSGPGQNDPLFDWLATTATMGEMRWFLEQEVAGEAGFDDLVALTQLRMPVRPKLEMARNYWDELGRGREVRMHGPMLGQVTRELRLHPQIDKVVWESLALSNLMLGLAANRRYAYHSVGALGAVELTAPSRVSLVDQGLARLGVSRQGRCYFTLHASIDVRHSREWNAEVIRPLIDQHPEVAAFIAEGALLRLCAGARCFARYRSVLTPGSQYPSAASRSSSRPSSRAPISFR